MFLRAAAWLALTCGAAATPAMAAPYSGLYVFGDSLSDVGNVYLGTGGAIPAYPYLAGRFSNGPNWVDDLSARLGLGAVVPSLAGGNDFAFGSAVTGPAVPGATTLVPNITQQVGAFTIATGGQAPSSALYAVWIGSNDVYTALDDLVASTLTFSVAQTDLTIAAQTEAGAIGVLVAEGARNLLVPLVPDLGTTPNVTDVPGLAPIAKSLSASYNTALVAAVNAATSGTGASVTYLDTFSLLDALVADPGAFGYTDATHRCYVGPFTGGGSVCATPNSYVFWDGQHPTAATDALVAQFAAAALPEPPAAWVLLAAGLALLGVRYSQASSARTSSTATRQIARVSSSSRW